MGHVTGFCLRNASFASWHSCANSTRTRVQARYELNQPPCTIQAAALGQASGASRAWPTSTTATKGAFPCPRCCGFQWSPACDRGVLVYEGRRLVEESALVRRLVVP